MRRLAALGRRGFLFLAVTGLTLGGHAAYRALVSGGDAVQERWAALPAAARGSRLSDYLRRQDYWVGLSFGMSLGFAAVAVRRWRESRSRGDRRLAVGGVGVSGLVAAAGCFLTGCCGSPMLGVYLGLLGASALPFTKPAFAGLTAVALIVSWRWMTRRPCCAAQFGTADLGHPECTCRR